MPQRPHRNSIPIDRAQLRPGQDMQMVGRQDNQFPAIGMTLRNYQYDPRDRHKRPDQTVVVQPTWWQRLWKKVTLKRAVITLALLVLVIGGWVGGKFFYNFQKLFGNPLAALHSTKLKGEDEGRVNILLAGNSADDPGHNGANLTDSIMIVSIDTRNNKAFLLSIPRDLWVDVDQDGHQKINEAYVTGQDNDFSAEGYPNGGMGQLEQVVSQNFGIPIHYYALVDYQAFKQSVDAVGGIDLTIKSEDPRGLYDPNIDWETKGPLVKLSNGRQHLNGRQALDLARARGDSYRAYGFAGSDFTRTEHQRQMLVALKTKATTAGVIANPAKLTSLADSIGNNVKTDLKGPEIHRLYDLGKKIGSSAIQSLSLNDVNGKSLLDSYGTPQGQSALIPAAGLDDFSDIQSFMARQTSSDPVVREGATVMVLNGTTTNGLATKAKKKLTDKKFIVGDVGDAAGAPATTSIIDTSAGKKPATKAALIKLFGNHIATANPYDGVYDADFIIVLGADQIPAAASSTTNQ